jgi:hypothetical protein
MGLLVLGRRERDWFAWKLRRYYVVVGLHRVVLF